MAQKKEDLSKLAPEDRIKKLKELEKKRKEEIEEAREQIMKDEKEITDRHRWVEKVPIPEVIQQDLDNLGEEGRQLLKIHRGWEEGKKVEEEKPAVKKEINLEDTVASERPGPVPDNFNPEYGVAISQGTSMDYGAALSQQNMAGIKGTVDYIQGQAEDKGYITADQQSTLEYAAAEVERRVEDAFEGKYHGFTEQVAEAASLIQQSTGRLMDMKPGYDSGSGVKYQ
jgi:hypothetical protein